MRVVARRGRTSGVGAVVTWSCAVAAGGSANAPPKAVAITRHATNPDRIALSPRFGWLTVAYCRRAVNGCKPPWLASFRRLQPAHDDLLRRAGLADTQGPLACRAGSPGARSLWAAAAAFPRAVRGPGHSGRRLSDRRGARQHEG